MLLLRYDLRSHFIRITLPKMSTTLQIFPFYVFLLLVQLHCLPRLQKGFFTRRQRPRAKEYLLKYLEITFLLAPFDAGRLSVRSIVLPRHWQVPIN